MAQGSNSAGTTDTRVDRPSEGLPGVANAANPTANPPTRANQDIGQAGARTQPRVRANIDTSGTSGLTQSDDLKRGEPTAW